MTCEPDQIATAPTMRERARQILQSRWTKRVAIGLALLLLLAVLLIGAFPVSLLKGRVEQRLSERVGASVTIGALEREPFFSFTPTVIIRDVRIPQPAWAGQGDMVRAKALRLRVPMVPALFGKGLKPDAIEAQGLYLALVRLGLNRANWQTLGQGSGGGGGLDLTDLTVRDGRVTLRDVPRYLNIAGTIEADRTKGLRINAKGRFHDAPVTLALTGDPIVDRGRDAHYPMELRIVSPLLEMTAKGHSNGALDLGDMALAISARAPSLKYVDNIIQAGLFGTQPVALRADVRHKGVDWFVDRLEGRVGRSELTGKADVLKRDGRTKIDATIAFSALDFDDLADDAGLAEDAAREARIGDRVLPNTRINLAKVGPTDGQIRFSAARLLFKSPSVFRSLKGIVKLDGKVLRLDDVEAQLTNGRMTGRMLVDHRTGTSPRLDLDLQFRDGQLGALLQAPERIDAPFGARVALTGRGDTIREALEHANGHVGFVAGDGSVSRLVAAVLAQDMGKTIGAAISGGDKPVALRCIAIGFDARGGVLTAAPFLIETEATRSRGEGTITLDGETIALTIGGTARDPSGLPLVDPIRIGGTLSSPSLELSAAGKGAGGILGAVVKSIGGALGLVEKKGPEVVGRGPVDCAAISQKVLQVGLPGGR